MLKTLKTLMSQDKEKYTVPKSVQDVIPISCIWDDGIFKVGNKFVKTYKFSDINYLVASREDKESMFLTYSELLNSLDSGATTKITINNHRMNKRDFEGSILMAMKEDGLDVYRKEYNQMLIDKATGANGIMQEKYITISVAKKDIEEARTYFARIGSDLCSHFAALGSKCTELSTTEKLRILHDFYRSGEEAYFHFDVHDMMKKGHDFKDYICPDSIEKNTDHLKLGEKFCRVLFLKDYASYIKDSMVSELTELNRNMMLSIDVVPIPTDEAIREVENRLLGVETNITNFQRKQNQNNNFSAVIPFDMQKQRDETIEFLEDLTSRDQRMMFAVVTMVITADSKEQLDADKIETLRQTLWDMNSITHSSKTTSKEIDVVETDADGKETTVKKTISETVLTINLTHKSYTEMIAEYGFNAEQTEQLNEMMSSEYDTMWAQLLGGYSTGTGEIIISNSEHIPKDIFAWALPESYTITSPFGYRSDPFTGKTKFHGGT